jgi:tetratricopeptide (TPR) repeat protein/TolB-like protein/predicted Ser/Thr protein kinase
MTCPACQSGNALGASRCARCGRELQADAAATLMPTSRATAKTGAAAAAPALAVSDSDPSMTQARTRPAQQAGTSDLDATVISNSPLSGEIAPHPASAGTSMAASRAAAQPSSAGWLPDFGPRYEVLSILGKGGMGAVYKARDLELDRVVALKLLRPELIPDAAAIQRFKQELLLASKISHRNILRIHDLGDANGVKFISMAYIEGQDLHGVIQKEGRLPLSRALNFARQTLEALEAAHREGVVHRDLKPQNIMVGASDHIYVMDFGLAKSAEADTHMTMTGQVVGTPQYMAPEQVEGGVIDHRADLYAFGLVFDEMLTGELVFKAESAFHLMLMRIREAPRPPRQVVPELPEYVERIVMRCLMRTPDERYQSAREILNDFDAEAAEAVPEQETLALSGGRAAAQQRKRKATSVLTVTLGAAIALGGVIVAVPSLRHRVETAVGLGAPAPAHVAVLPLQIAGDDSHLAVVALGIQQSLTGKLAAARQVTVTDSAAIDKIDPTKPAARIAAQLGANFLVRGTLQSGKDGKFGIAMTLIDMRNGGKQVTLPLIESTSADLLTTEGKIYDEVSSSLSLKLSNDEQAAAQSQTTQNAEAYDFYLQGKNAMRGQADVKNVMKAVGLFQSATEKDGRFALAWAGLADAYMALYNFDKNKTTADNALSAARQASAFDTEFRIPQVHFTVGDILGRTGSTDQALGELRQAVQRAPNVDEGYRRLAHAYLAKQPAEAVTALQRAIEINPFYWLNHNELALAYKKMGNYAGATKEWTEVTRLDPENLFALNNLAGLAVLNGRFSDAVANFQAVIKIRPTAPAYSNLGTAYYYLGQYANAVAAFQKAVDLKPDNALNLENLADGLRLSGRAAQAAPLYEKAIGLALGQLKVNPKDTFTKSILALCYAKTGKNLDAATQIEDAVKLEPADSDLLYSKALVQAFAGEDGAAVATLKEAIAKGAQPYTAKAEPDFARLRTKSEFQAIVAGTAAK